MSAIQSPHFPTGSMFPAFQGQGTNGRWLFITLK